MESGQPNLFCALFEFRPREGFSPSENFLSEAFAYVLRTDEEALNAWLTLVYEQPVTSTRSEITTRNTERLDKLAGLRYPDMKAVAQVGADERVIFSEHKWRSPTNPGQLRDYAEIAKRHNPTGILVFIGANRREAEAARATGLPTRVLRFTQREDLFVTS